MNGKKLNSSGFARMYVWVTRAKYTMGIFFVAYVFLYLLFGLVSEGPTVTLDFFTAIQMILACFLIGLLQQAILPAGRLGRARCALWVLCGVVVTLGFSLAFGWFAAFPLWCSIVFPIVAMLGMLAVIFGYYLELHRETKRLNRGLAQFQNRASRKEG